VKVLATTLTLLACAGLFLTGCASQALHAPGATSALSESLARDARTDTEAAERPGSMLIWTARLTVEVDDVRTGMDEAVAVAKRFGGYVEESSDRGEKSASIRLRLPAAAFIDAVGAIEKLGTVSYKSVASEDVTEQYIDIEARLKNKRELRDRLRALLDKAVNVKDVIAIETELNRVQSDIDAMEGRIRHLKGQVDFATVDLTLERRKVLGPLGYLARGVWWCIEKLFVIRD